jgi:hypothetical protein
MLFVAAGQSSAQTPKLSQSEADNACANYAAAIGSGTEQDHWQMPDWKFKCEHNPRKGVCEETQNILEAVRGRLSPPLKCGQ